MKKKKGNTLFLAIISAILILSLLANISRILFADVLTNLEVYHYPSEASLVYKGEEKMSSDIYYVNTYLYRKTVHRINEDKALDIINSPKMELKLDGYTYYLSDENEIIFSVHTHFIRERSIIDRVFMMLFYDNTNNLYYSTKADDEHFDTLLSWYNIFYSPDEYYEKMSNRQKDIDEMKNEEKDKFNFIMNKEVIRTEIDPQLIEYDVDIAWLNQQLKSAKMSKSPTEIIPLELEIRLYYEDGTVAKLRVRDDRNNICSIYYEGDSFAFESQSITEWMMNID